MLLLVCGSLCIQFSEAAKLKPVTKFLGYKLGDWFQHNSARFAAC